MAKRLYRLRAKPVALSRVEWSLFVFAVLLGLLGLISL